MVQRSTRRIKGARAYIGVLTTLMLAATGAVLAQSPVRGTSEKTPAFIELDGTSGEAVFKTKCAVCHELPIAGKGINIPPDLRYEGNRVQYDWLVGFLLNPARPQMRWQSEGVRSPLLMPPFKMNRKLAEELARYLMTRRDDVLIPNSGVDWDSTRSPEIVVKGRELFDAYQCRGCHKLAGTGNEIGPGLDGVGSRLRPDFMFRWLLDPQRIVPDTPMTNKDLWEDEAQAIVQYLRTLRGDLAHGAAQN